MNKVAFKNLLIYFKQLLIDKKLQTLKETLLEYIAWLCYSIVHFKKDYIEYLTQLNSILTYINTDNYEDLYVYLEDNILYWDLNLDEEDY